MDKTVLFDLSYGVCAVGSLYREQQAGCIVNTVFQVTSDPMTVGISVNKNNFTEHFIRESGRFSVSVLSENTPMEVIGTFGFRTSKDTDKFSLVNSLTAPDGMPVVNERTVSYFTCRVIKEIDVMTHTVFIGEVTEAEKLSSEIPMTYAYYHEVKKGKSAPNAPTYQTETAKTQNKEVAYVCSICNYRFEGTEEEFEALPDDWVCPLCGMPKEKFIRLKSAPENKKYVCSVCGYVFEGTEEEFEELQGDWVCPVCRVGKDKFSLVTE